MTPSAPSWSPTTTASTVASPPPTSSSTAACTRLCCAAVGAPPLDRAAWQCGRRRFCRRRARRHRPFLPGGAPLRAALLVAADGGKSRLREVAGIGIVRWSYPQTGIVTTVRHEKPHRGRAVQHFLPAGPFAILPLTGNRSCITWTEEAERAARSWRSMTRAFSPRSRRASTIAWVPSSWRARAPPGRSTCISPGRWWPTASRSSAMRRTACTRSPAKASTSACATWPR